MQNALTYGRKKIAAKDAAYGTGLALFYLLVFVKYVFSVPVPGALILVPYAVAALAADREKLTVLALCTVPLYTSVQFVSAIGICAAVFLITFADGIKPKKADVILLFLVVWELLHAFTVDFSAKEFVGIAILYVFMTIAIRSHGEPFDYVYMARNVAGSTLFTCFVILMQLFARYNFNADKTWKSLLRLGTDYVDGETPVGAYLNPNTLGFFIVISVALLVQLMLTRRSGKADVAATAALLVFGFFTSSRTFLICLFITGALAVLSARRSAGEKVKVFAIAVASFAAACLVFYLIAPDTFAFFFDRVVNGGDNSRWIIFSKYNGIIFNSPKFLLWGSGLNGVAAYQMEVVGQVPHNGLQELLFVWGFPGLIAYAGYVSSLFYGAYRSNKNKARLINFIPLILFLIKIQIGQLVTFTPVPLVILLICISLSSDLYTSPSKAQ